MASCTYTPRNKKGEELKGFKEYRKELGYEMGSQVFTQVLSPQFQEDFKKSLAFDEQGVPTYGSAIRTSHIKNFVGNKRLIDADQKKYPYVQNTRDNYRRLLDSAYVYNTSSANRDDFVAVVTAGEKGLRVEIRERTVSNANEFRNQYNTSKLNDRLVELLEEEGLTVELLENNERTNGVVDFSKASSIAEGFKGLIRIADGMEGELALSEEFAHTVIGMFRNTPFIQRSLSMLSNNDSLVKEILGDEYEENVSYYSEHPNYDENGREMPLNETLAEEALGRVLQEKLKTTNTPSENSKPLDSLVSRFIKWIKGIFKGKDSDAITRAMNEIDTTMGELAKDVLTGTKKLSKEELIKNQRNASFNHLKESTDKVLQLLRNADEIERKRSKITAKDKVDEVKKRIIKLEALINDKDKLTGLCTYAKWALSDLQGAMDKLNVTGALTKDDFTTLRHIKSVLDSYSEFINDFHEVLDEMGDDYVLVIDGEEVNLKSLWRDIDEIYKSSYSAFKKQALAAFSDFLAPIYDKSPLRNEDGSIKPLNEVLIEEDFDISEFDRWLVSMGNSSSIILQMFGNAVNNAKNNARLATTSNIRDIWKIRDNAEKRGITSFEWMFEKDDEGHKTGNYISQYNIGKFKKEEEAMKERILEKYGKHPVGEDFIKADAERRAWYDSHADRDMFNNPIPNETYRNPAYERLSKAQLETLNEILAYKDRIEYKLPPDRRDVHRAIQKRRSSAQRTIDAATSPMQAFKGLIDDAKSAFRSAEDDDIMYGERTHGLTDFTGQEYLTLPVLYTGRLKNPDTLSTDIFADLMAYAYMANNYEEMSQIYDPLEIGVAVVADKEFIKSADSKAKEEVINVLGKVSKKNIKVGSNTSFAKKLRDYLECQVYGRYMKEDDIVGKDVQKTVGFFQRMTSLAYLGCNWLAGVANVATAVGMQNIEAASGEFFGAKELGKADWAYRGMLAEFIAELANRKKQSKLALFDELFDVRQNFKDKLHNVQMKNIFQRFFGVSWTFLQQGMGDHWIYNRTAIAMAMREKVIVDGKETSVWDALEIVTDKNGYKIMKVKDGTKNLDGSNFSVGDFSRKIAHINHTIAGIYNDEDQNAANRVMIGRLGQQMRKWIIPQFMRRFQSKRTILDIGREEEGYYRTAARLAKDLWKSEFKIKAEWDKLTDSEKANVRRAITEMSQTFALWIITMSLASGTKDPDRSWAAKFAEYMANRELHELGFLTPSPLMLTEGYKTVTSPFVAASAANKLAQAILTTSNPVNWFPDDDELIQSGRYEGHSYIYKRWAELPLPPMTQVRQLEKFFDELDTGTKYYAKDYK